MAKTGIKGSQIRDNSIDENDIDEDSIRASEISSEAITGQGAYSGDVDTVNDKILIYDDSASSLKKVSPGEIYQTTSPSIRVSNGQSTADNRWIKIARTSVAGDGYETNVTTLLVTITAMEYRDAESFDGSFLIQAKFSAKDSSPYYYSFGTQITCEPLNADDISGFDPTSDLAITLQDQDANLMEIWIKAPTQYKEVFAAHVGGTNLLDFYAVDPSAVIQTNQSWSASLTSLGTEIYGTWASKVISGLTVSGDVNGSYVAIIDNDQSSNGHGLKITSDGTGTGTNILDVESASTTHFRIRGDGRVGMGKVTSLPSARLTLSGSGTDVDLSIDEYIQHTGDSNTTIRFTDDQITFAAGGSEELKIASDAILVKQHIKHDGDEDTLINFVDNKIVLKAGNLALVTAEKKGSAPHEVTINDGSNNVDFVVKGNGSGEGNPGMKFDASTNKLGINGVGTPDETLHVDGNIKVVGEDPRIKIDGDVDSHPGLEFYENGTRKWIIFNNYGDDSLDFKTNSTTRMVINQDGTVGIGTQSPASELHINGALTLTEKSSDPSNPSEGQSVLWMSDGSGTGDDGDILMKITAGGVTKTVTLVDFSSS